MNNFKEEVNWSNQKYLMEWSNKTNFESLSNPRNTMGFIFDKNNKLCIIKFKNRNHWTLPGGAIEKNETPEESLIRETLEEADIKIKNLKRIGYFNVKPLSTNCKRNTHQHLRFIAQIEKINEQTIDPAEGYIPKRKFINPKEFAKMSKWGEGGKMQIKIALEKLKEITQEQPL